MEETESLLGNRNRAKNKKTKTATLKNILTFQVEQQPYIGKILKTDKQP